MDTEPISNCCPKCQAPLPADAPQGLCPKCLLAAVAQPTDADQPTGHRATPPPLEEIAAAFPQLEILEFIGQGGMGFVFKARQPKLDRLVALKILPQSLAADPTFAERFNREARLLARLNHPGIVTVHDFGVATGRAGSPLPAASEDDDERRARSDAPYPPQTPDASFQTQFYYLLMEFVDGVNLRQAMQAGRFTPEQALAIVPKICEALQFAHNEGILHRDIKPENILLDAKGRVKLADFGIAKLVGDVGQAFQPAGAGDFPVASSGMGEGRGENTGLESPVNRQAGKPALRPDALTEAGKALGTPNYMAPEQRDCSGEVDHRADIYSLGVVFYEMLTGELPLGRFAPPSQKSAADPRVDEVVLRALEKEKARRPASADEVRTQVETIAETQKSSGRETGLHGSRAEKPDDELPTFMPALYAISWLTLCGTIFSLVLAALARGTGVWVVSGMAASAMFAVLAVVYTQRLADPALRRKLLITHRGYEYVTAIMLVALGFIATVAIVHAQRRSVDPDWWWWFSVVAMGLAVLAVWIFKQSGRTANSVDATPHAAGVPPFHTPPRKTSTDKRIAIGCIILALAGGLVVLVGIIGSVFWFRFTAMRRSAAERTAQAESHQQRSNNSRMQPARVKFSFKHPEALVGGHELTLPATTRMRWLPNIGQPLSLTNNRQVLTRVRLLESNAATVNAEAACSDDGINWETQMIPLSADAPKGKLRFKNGIEATVELQGPGIAGLSQAPIPSFGPVIERVVNEMESGRGHEGLRLESGELVSIPKGNANQWLKDTSVDLLVGRTGREFQLIIQKGILRDMDNADWENATPEILRNALGKGTGRMKPGKAKQGWEAYDWTGGELPATFALHLASGTDGIVQVLGSTSDGTGVKLRYKLVQRQSSEPVVASAIPRDGVYFTYTGYMTTVLELKSGRFRYWFETDEKAPDEPEYPISGPIRITADTIALIHEKCSQPTWTFRTMDGHRTLWRPDALAIPAADCKWDMPMLKRYGAGSVLIASDKRAEELWERRRPPSMPESAGAAGIQQVSEQQLNQGSRSTQTNTPSAR